MKQFSLEEYLKNPLKKVVTRDGRAVKIYCTDYIDKCGMFIIAKIEGNAYSYSFREDGRFLDCKETDNDLFFVPEKHGGWANVFKSSKGNNVITSDIFESKEEAEKAGKNYNNYVATAKVEWED